ncbi:MAG: TolC family protein, partial [Planctomycetota bacterium]
KSETTGDDADQVGDAASDDSAATDSQFVDAVRQRRGWLREWHTLSRGMLVAGALRRQTSADPKTLLEDARSFVKPVEDLFNDASSNLDDMEKMGRDPSRFLRQQDALRFDNDRKRLRERLTNLRSGRDGFESLVDQLDQLTESYSEESQIRTIRGLTAWIQRYLQMVERLSLIPAQARLELIDVPEVDLEPELAYQIALTNRLDLMNGRAALVDRWRAIQVASDALQSQLTITANGDVRTAGNNPVDFRAATSRMRLGIEFDAPLARLLERNGYREALIEYQRSRRSLIQSRDGLHRGLRALLRNLLGSRPIFSMSSRLEDAS